MPVYVHFAVHISLKRKVKCCTFALDKVNDFLVRELYFPVTHREFEGFSLSFYTQAEVREVSKSSLIEDSLSIYTEIFFQN